MCKEKDAVNSNDVVDSKDAVYSNNKDVANSHYENVLDWHSNYLRKNRRVMIFYYSLLNDDGRLFSSNKAKEKQAANTMFGPASLLETYRIL